jgi:U4/U6 small nuclear ribonucleoprotein PRP3
LGLSGLDLRKIEVVTDLVEHPELIDPPIIEKKLPVPIYLTKEERIKIRRQRRREAELEKREKIRMGLVLPDDPKLKLSNFMRSKTDEAVLAPSSLESSVRKQMEVRLQAGILHNELNKLTKEQRSEKKTKRLMEDTSQKAHIAVFRLNHMKNSKNRYKVDINAQQFKLTGRIITSPDVCIVIAEGGPKNIKKYKKLLLNRIKWAEEDLAEPAGPSESGGFVKNECRLVWEGTVKRRAFGNWKVKSFSSSSQAREHLTRFHVEHYWDLGITEAIMEMENIDEAE